MASFQEFQKDNIRIRYFKDSNVLYLLPTKVASKEKMALLKKQLETFLSVDSLKTQKNGLSLKLADSAMSNVPEMLKAIGASGGETVEDAASVAQEPAESEAKEAEKETGQPTEDPTQQPPGAPGQMAGGPQGMPLAAHAMPKIFTMMYENTFGLESSFGKPKKPGRRTGKYWEPLERVTGKNRAKIAEQDVLNLRKKHSKKPESKDRNKILRSLDRAFNYFYGKIEESKGRQTAEKYAEDYYALDNLNPKDYAIQKGKPKPIGPEEEVDSSVDNDEINGPDFVDFAELLDRDEDSYDNIEIEEETW